MSRFEMPLGDGVSAVAYYKAVDSRVVLLIRKFRKSCPARETDRGWRMTFSKRRDGDGKRVIAKCPFMPSYAAQYPRVRSIPRWLTADGRDAGAHFAFRRRYR